MFNYQSFNNDMQAVQDNLSNPLYLSEKDDKELSKHYAREFNKVFKKHGIKASVSLLTTK